MECTNRCLRGLLLPGNRGGGQTKRQERCVAHDRNDLGEAAMQRLTFINRTSRETTISVEPFPLDRRWRMSHLRRNAGTHTHTRPDFGQKPICARAPENSVTTGASVSTQIVDNTVAVPTSPQKTSARVLNAAGKKPWRPGDFLGAMQCTNIVQLRSKGMQSSQGPVIRLWLEACSDCGCSWC